MNTCLWDLWVMVGPAAVRRLAQEQEAMGDIWWRIQDVVDDEDEVYYSAYLAKLPPNATDHDLF